MAIRKYGRYGKIGPAWGFTWGEVRCKDGTLPLDAASRKHHRYQAVNLNRLRAQVRNAHGGRLRVKRVSIFVNSWYRSPTYNRKIGGALYSQHKYSRATDITVKVYYRNGIVSKVHPRRVAELAARVKAFRNGGIGWYDLKHGNFTHVDHRPNGPARWIN